MFRVCLISLLLMTSIALASEKNNESGLKNVKLASCEWAPFSGKLIKDRGFTTEIIKKSFANQGVKVKVDFMPWARVIKVVQSGEYDAAFPAYYSKDREKYFKFSKPFIASPIHLCTLSDSKIKYEKLEDLKPYKIGIVNGYVNSQEFDAVDFLNKKKSNSDKINLIKLVNKRIDMIVIDKFASEFYRVNDDQLKKYQFKYLDPPLQTKDLHLMISKNISNSGNILRTFEKGLDKFIKSGNIEKYLENY
jgi:polar amino acid transport system substrate-binding protein